MRREKWRKKENHRSNGSREFSSECLASETPGDGELDRCGGDLRCVFCGTYEDLKGHVDSEKNSEIFYLCGTCCKQLHG